MVFMIGAIPGDNQVEDCWEIASMAMAPSPYQVLRVAYCSAGMVKCGVMLSKAIPSAAGVRPPAAPGTRDPLAAEKVVPPEVYSMAWIYQLEPVRPTLVLSFKVQLGPETVDQVTQVHLLTVVKPLTVVSGMTMSLFMVRALTLVNSTAIFVPVIPHMVLAFGQPTWASSSLLF